MKLYVTPLSPYARFARIVVLEKRLESRVEVIAAQTRVADSPYYAINPSGRAPYLLREDGVGMEDSALICAYLDHVDGEPAFASPAGDEAWQLWRLEALARSLVDGLTVWGRELRHRPERERSRGSSSTSGSAADGWRTSGSGRSPPRRCAAGSTWRRSPWPAACSTGPTFWHWSGDRATRTWPAGWTRSPDGHRWQRQPPGPSP